VHYVEDPSGQTRETRVEASFPSYDEVRGYGLTSVLCTETGSRRMNLPSMIKRSLVRRIADMGRMWLCMWSGRMGRISWSVF